MEITQLNKITDEVMSAFEYLIPQLTSNSEIPSKEDIAEIIEAKNSFVFLAKEKEIIGILTLIIYKIPTGKKAWIEDVVVDSKIRGKGTGRLLVEHAIQFTKEKGISKIDLTSSPSRVAANILYRKMGFDLRDSNVYRLRIIK